MAELEDGMNANRVEKALKSIGVALRDSSGEFRNLDEVFNDLGATWSSLSRNQKAYIASMAAGSRQQSRFMAIMNDYDRTLELIRTSTNSAGEANLQYAVYLDSIEAAQNKLTNSLEAFYVKISSSDIIKTVYNDLTNLVKILTELGPILDGIIALTTVLIIKYVVAAGAIQQVAIAEALKNGIEASELKGLPKFIAGITKKIFFRKAEAAATINATTALVAYQAVAFGAIAVIAGLAAVIYLLISNYKSQAQVANEAYNEQVKLAESSQQDAMRLDNLVDRYEELSVKIFKTTAEQQELLTVTQQIADLSPRLVTGITAEGDARLANLDILKEEVKNRLMIARLEAEDTLDSRTKYIATQTPLEKEGLSETAQGYLNKIDESKKKIKSVGAGLWFGDDEEGAFDDSVQKIVIDLKSREINLNEARQRYATFLDEIKTRHWGDFKKLSQIRIANTYVEEYFKSWEMLDTQKVVDELDIQTSNINRVINGKMVEALYLNPDAISKETQKSMSEIGSQFLDSIMQNDSLTNAEKLIEMGESKATIEKEYNILIKAEEKGGDAYRSAQEKVAELIKKGASKAEIYSAQEEMVGILGDRLTITEKDVIKRLQFNTNIFDSRINDFVSRITNPDEQKVVKTAMDGLSMSLQEDIIKLYQNMENGFEKTNFPGLVDNIFGDTSFAKSFEKAFNETDMKDPSKVLALTEQLAAQIVKTIGIDLPDAMRMARKIIPQSEDAIADFIKASQTAYDELKKLNDEVQKNASGFEAGASLSATDTYGVVGFSEKANIKGLGIDKVTDNTEGFNQVGGVFALTGTAIEQRRIEVEKALTDNLDKLKASVKTKIADNQQIITDLQDLPENKITDTQKELLAAKKEENEELNKQLEYYQKIYDSIINVTAAEKARKENQQFLTGANLVNAVIKSLKSLSDIYLKLNDEGYTQLEIVDLITSNPDYLQFLTVENDLLALSKDLMKAEAQARLDSLKAKLNEQVTTLTMISGYMAEGEAREAIIKQIEKYNALLKGLPTVDELFSGGKTKPKFEAYFGEFDRYFNYLEKLKRIAADMDEVTAKIERATTGGAEDIRLLMEKNKLLAQQAKTLEELLAARKKQAATEKAALLNNKSYKGYISEVDGVIKVNWLKIQQYKIDSEAKEKWYQGLLDAIDAYTTEIAAIEDDTAALDDNIAKREEAEKTLRQSLSDTRQQIYDALVEADQAEIDATKEKFDKMKEVQDKYLEAVKKAIDDERKAREQSNKAEDLAAKKRKLATLERDTSGLFAQEVEKLRKEISGDEQTARDEAIDRQYELLQKQYENDQKRYDLEVQALEEQMKQAEESGRYWEEVNAAILAGPERMAEILTSTEEFAALDPLVKDTTAKDIANAVDSIAEVFKVGSSVAASGATPGEVLDAGIEKITNPTTTTSPADGGTTTTPTSFAYPGTLFKQGMTNPFVKWIQSALNEKIKAKLPITGYYGPLTEAAVRAFQKSLGWKDDGTVGKNTWGKLITKAYPYAKGGLVDYTGPAWVHGSNNSPEAFLSADQTKLFAALRDVLENNVATNSSIGVGDTSISIGDIVIQLQNDTNASASEIAKQVKKEILASFTNRITTPIQRTR